MQANDQLQRINSKLQVLLRRYDQLQKDNERLKKENETLKTRQDQLSGRNSELERSLAVFKTLSGKMDAGDKKELEKRLNGYLKEIDRCISLLGE